MAIGTGWADGAWVDAGWITEAWDDVPYTVPVAKRGQGRKARLIQVDNLLKPWETEPDEFINEVIRDIKRPKLKIVKRAPQPDFDSVLESERIDRELIAELKKTEKARKDRLRRHKKIIMLLLS